MKTSNNKPGVILITFNWGLDNSDHTYTCIYKLSMTNHTYCIGKYLGATTPFGSPVSLHSNHRNKAS